MRKSLILLGFYQLVNNHEMETLFFTGVILSISANHLVWTMPRSARELEDEKYWEMKVKSWEKEREREERLKNVA